MTDELQLKMIKASLSKFSFVNTHYQIHLKNKTEDAMRVLGKEQLTPTDENALNFLNMIKESCPKYAEHVIGLKRSPYGFDYDWVIDFDSYDVEIQFLIDCAEFDVAKQEWCDKYGSD